MSTHKVELLKNDVASKARGVTRRTIGFSVRRFLHCLGTGIETWTDISMCIDVSRFGTFSTWDLVQWCNNDGSWAHYTMLLSHAHSSFAFIIIHISVERTEWRTTGMYQESIFEFMKIFEVKYI